MAKGISETAFSSQVEYLLDLYQWHWAHFRPAWTNKGWRTPVSGHGKGFLDYLCLRPPRILVVELKDENKPMSPEQQEWFDLWEECQRVTITTPLTVQGKVATVSIDKPLNYLMTPEVYLWRPSDMDPEGGRILEILR